MSMPEKIYAGYYKLTDDKDWCWSPEIVEVMKQEDWFVGYDYVRHDLYEALEEKNKRLAEALEWIVRNKGAHHNNVIAVAEQALAQIGEKNDNK